jgi:hypothetical protein
MIAGCLERGSGGDFAFLPIDIDFLFLEEISS